MNFAGVASKLDAIDTKAECYWIFMNTTLTFKKKEINMIEDNTITVDDCMISLLEGETLYHYRGRIVNPEIEIDDGNYMPNGYTGGDTFPCDIETLKLKNSIGDPDVWVNPWKFFKVYFYLIRNFYSGGQSHVEINHQHDLDKEIIESDAALNVNLPQAEQWSFANKQKVAHVLLPFEKCIWYIETKCYDWESLNEGFFYAWNSAGDSSSKRRQLIALFHRKRDEFKLNGLGYHPDSRVNSLLRIKSNGFNTDKSVSYYEKYISGAYTINGLNKVGGWIKADTKVSEIAKIELRTTFSDMRHNINKTLCESLINEIATTANEELYAVKHPISWMTYNNISARNSNSFKCDWGGISPNGDERREFINLFYRKHNNGNTSKVLKERLINYSEVI